MSKNAKISSSKNSNPFSELNYEMGHSITKPSAHLETSFLSSYFQIFSFLFVVPFRVQVNRIENTLLLIPKKKSGQLLCIIIQFASLTFNTITTVYHISKYMTFPPDAWAVMTLLCHFFDQTLYIIIFYVFWKEWARLEDLLNQLCVRNRTAKTSASHKLINVLRKPPVIIIISYLFNFLAGVLSPYRRELLRTVSNTIMECILPYEGAISSVLKSLLVYPLCLLLLFFQRMNCIFEILVLSSVLSMLTLANDFRKDVTDHVSPQKLMERFSGLRETFNLCNGVFGRAFLNHSIVTLLYYINTPAVLTKMSITLDKLYKLIYLMFHCIIYFGACEIHKKVKSKVKDYVYIKKLNEDVSQTDLIKLSILAGEVEDDPVGIYCVLFTINYAFLASYLGLLGTYAIFTWQMQRDN